jgi:hypothetical protein
VEEERQKCKESWKEGTKVRQIWKGKQIEESNKEIKKERTK